MPNSVRCADDFDLTKACLMLRHPRESPPPSRSPRRVRGIVPGLTAWGLLLALVSGCATMGVDQGQPLVPTRHEQRTGPFVVFSATPLGADAPPIRCLRALEADVGATLGVRAGGTETPVEVYILRDRETFTHFLTFYFPELPPRRAFFIAQGGRRVVYTFQNERLEEDLRHEASHALLHLTVGDLPLWLDEGLAEYFEVIDAPRGLNAEHVERLPDDLAGGWRPDLARLETVHNVRDMSPRDYRESWAWVHYLLNESAATRAQLLAWLFEIRRGATEGGLAGRVEASDAKAVDHLLAHVGRLRSAPAPATASAEHARRDRASPPTVLLQNSPIEPPPQRRSLLNRFFSLLGGGRSSEPR